MTSATSLNGGAEADLTAASSRDRGLARLAHAAEQVGLEQEPEAGECGGIAGRLGEQVNCFGLARVAAGGIGRLEAGAVGERFGQSEAKVFGQSRLIGGGAD